MDFLDQLEALMYGRSATDQAPDRVQTSGIMEHFNVHFSEVIESTRLESIAELKTAMQQ